MGRGLLPSRVFTVPKGPTFQPGTLPWGTAPRIHSCGRAFGGLQSPPTAAPQQPPRHGWGLPTPSLSNPSWLGAAGPEGRPSAAPVLVPWDFALGRRQLGQFPPRCEAQCRLGRLPGHRAAGHHRAAQSSPPGTGSSLGLLLGPQDSGPVRPGLCGCARGQWRAAGLALRGQRSRCLHWTPPPGAQGLRIGLMHGPHPQGPSEGKWGGIFRPSLRSSHAPQCSAMSHGVRYPGRAPREGPLPT